MKTAFFTICSKNYLAYALTLRDSLMRHEPEHDVFVFLADSTLDANEIKAVKIINVSDLGCEDLPAMALRYTLMEFNTSIKPLCFQHLFKRLKYDCAIYLDPDIEVFGPLTEAHTAFASGASCVLTPHILQPLEDMLHPSDIDILQSGSFNLGFAAFRNTAETGRFLSWWADRLKFDCFVDFERGLFVDQKFVEFAPSFLSNLRTLRHPGYNVAYWNLAHRPLERRGSDWRVGDLPLRFFHFSGVVPQHAEILSKHQDRFSSPDSVGLRGLFRSYIEKLEANGQSHWSTLPYAFNYAANGMRIPDPIRPYLASNQTIDAPFTIQDLDYWNAPSERVDQDAGYTITRLMYALYQKRPDLKNEFPLSRKTGRRGFCDWFEAYGQQEYGLRDKPSFLDVSSTENRRPVLARLRSALRRFTR